jgi:hypothetical protein
MSEEIVKVRELLIVPRTALLEIDEVAVLVELDEGLAVPDML